MMCLWKTKLNTERLKYSQQFEGKVYNQRILPVISYDAESWSLTKALVQKHQEHMYDKCLESSIKK